MTKIYYSCIKKTIYVYGCLIKTTSEDFSFANITSLAAELINCLIFAMFSLIWITGLFLLKQVN